MSESKIQSQLDNFVNAVEASRESFGMIGGEANTENVSTTQESQESLMDSLTAAAVTNDLKFSGPEADPVTLTRVYRIEHQTWIRGESENGDIECINLLNRSNIDLV